MFTITIAISITIASLVAGFLLDRARRREDDGSPVAPGSILLQPDSEGCLSTHIFGGLAVGLRSAREVTPPAA